MLFRPCVFLGVVDIWLLVTATIAVSCVWAFSMLRLYMDDSCSHCGDMNISALRRLRLDYLKRYRFPSATPQSSSSFRKRATLAGSQGDLRVTVWASPTSQPPRATPPSQMLQPVEFPDEFAGPSQQDSSISFGAQDSDLMSIATSQGGLESMEDEDSAALPPSGVPMLPESDPELTTMLSRAAESIGLEWNPPPCPERLRLDDWFLGAACGDHQHPPPVPFFPEVHQEVTSSWKAPLTARNRSGAISAFTALDGGAAKGYAGIPPVERSVAMQLCPQSTSTWHGAPKLPSKACKFSSTLVAKVYRAAGQAASALHTMATLQVYQAKVLKELQSCTRGVLTQKPCRRRALLPTLPLGGRTYAPPMAEPGRHEGV